MTDVQQDSTVPLTAGVGGDDMSAFYSEVSRLLHFWVSAGADSTFVIPDQLYSR